MSYQATKMSICGYGGTNRMRPILRFGVSSIPTSTTVSGRSKPASDGRLKTGHF